ncbi:hypothetical protein Cgig2_023692 [Carnegiea gigantea]|uniref:Uncharacterized protein n=1 Tax=Carnegiea gigantea TaxID=171969 RepID=A0A9Q1QK17_9CARY|nr:hypothetical protein Cgig2_023692 [Carnegiea gigantea]
MGIAVNLVTYLIGTMHLPSATSANIVTDFMGTSFLLCLLGRFVADAFLAFYLIALGTGAIKSSVSGFGSDQFDENHKEKAQMTYFLNRCLDKAALVAEGDFKVVSGSAPTPNPWRLCSVTRIEEGMARSLPVWATTIMFWTTYAQMITFSVEQASTMERSIGSFQIPAESLTVFFVAAILITLAVYDCLVMPFWKTWKGTPGFTHFQRTAIGLALSTLGMAAAVMAEKKRLAVAEKVGRNTQTLAIRVYLLIPQFFLVGAGEAFIYTGQLDFFITQSPRGMKTMSTGLFLTTLSLGFFVSSFLVSVINAVTAISRSQGWLADDINHGRLDYFYGLLSMLGFINFGVFMVCAVWYSLRRRGIVPLRGLVVMGFLMPRKVVEFWGFSWNLVLS